MAVEKTPVSILNEMMTKIGSTPVYEFCQNEMDIVQKLFTFKVSCAGIMTTGTGRSKKDAKQNAATAMLEKITRRKVVTQSSQVSNELPQLPSTSNEPPIVSTLSLENKDQDYYIRDLQVLIFFIIRQK